MTLKSFADPTSDEARQFLLDRRSERAHPKRHRTLGRRRRLSAQKKRAAKQRQAESKKARALFLAAVQAYWKGASDGYPTP